MPFAARELSVLAYANGFTLWHYRTDDSAAALTDPDGAYFAAADELLRPGDQIMVTLLQPGTVRGAGLVVTAVVPGRAVEVAPLAGGSAMPSAPAQNAAAAGRMPAAAH